MCVVEYASPWVNRGINIVESLCALAWKTKVLSDFQHTGFLTSSAEMLLYEIGVCVCVRVCVCAHAQIEKERENCICILFAKESLFVIILGVVVVCCAGWKKEL